MNAKYQEVYNKLMDPARKLVERAKLIPMLNECGFTLDKQLNGFVEEEFKFKQWITQDDLQRIISRFEKKHNNGDELKAKLKLLFDDGSGEIDADSFNKMMVKLGIQ